MSEGKAQAEVLVEQAGRKVEQLNRAMARMKMEDKGEAGQCSSFEAKEDEKASQVSRTHLEICPTQLTVTAR
jgi:hypothetical protein